MGDSPSCKNHPSRPARWFCWTCGSPLCEECVILRRGQYHCENCIKDSETVADTEETEDSFRLWPDIHYEANLIKRLLAFEVDFVILLLAGGLISLLLGIIFQLGVSDSQKIFLLLFYGGLLVRDGVFPGGSPGKRMMQLYVWNRRQDRPVNLRDSLLRNLFFPVFYFDLLTVPFSPDRQRAGDILAGTVVYDEKFQIQEKKYIYRSAGLTSLLLAGLVVIFVSWFAAEMRHRAPVYELIAEETVERVEGIEGAISRLPVEHRNLEVLEENQIVSISSEYPDASTYFEARSEITSLLEENNYEIIEVHSPQMIFRGPDETYYGLTIEAQQ